MQEVYPNPVTAGTNLADIAFSAARMTTNVEPYNAYAQGKESAWRVNRGFSSYWGQAIHYMELSAGTIASGWELIRALPVKIEQDEDGYYIVSDDTFLVYGEGRTLEEAQQDYTESLIDYYEIIATRAGEGHIPTHQLLQLLQEYLHPVGT